MKSSRILALALVGFSCLIAAGHTRADVGFGADQSLGADAFLAEARATSVPAEPQSTTQDSYRSAGDYAWKPAAVNAMMNCASRLLKTGVAIFEKKIIELPGGRYGFEIKYLRTAKIGRYVSREVFGSAVAALGASMNTEAAMLKTSSPVFESRVIDGGNSRYAYEIVLLSDAQPRIFVQEEKFATKIGALDAMSGAERGLTAGKVGVIEKRITDGGGYYSFEIVYRTPGR